MASNKSSVNNTYNVYCKADKLLPGIEKISNSLDSVTTAMNEMTGGFNGIIGTLQQILLIQKHIHDSHWHPTSHYAGSLSGPTGSLFIPIQPDEIDLLIQESQTGLDKDLNNLVYMRDFHISDNDPKKPLVLRDVENHFRYDGIPIPTKSMTWKAYLKTLPWCK